MTRQRYVLFDAGGHSLAVPAENVQAIHDDLPVQSIEGTRHWFLGLAVADGKLLPVSDLGMLFGSPWQGSRVLQLHPDIGIAGLRVDSVSGLSDANGSVQAADAVDTPRFNDKTLSLADAVTTLEMVQDGSHHRLLDLAALLQSEAFLDIAVTTA